MVDSTTDEGAASGARRRWWPVVKWTLFAVVLLFVVRRGYALWTQQQAAGPVETTLDVVWLIPAGVAYFVGWLPSVWFWRKMMADLGGQVSYPLCLRAYFCGHLGKYIPGKASALLIRGAMLHGQGTTFRVATLTAACETLILMGAGAALATALAPTILSDAQWAELPGVLRGLRHSPAALPILTVVALTIALPLMSLVFTKVALSMVPRTAIDEPVENPRISARLIAAGLALFVLAWGCHGLSLGCTLRAVSPGPLDLSDWPSWTGIASLATVIGFFAIFAPGGMGVREGLLIEMLRIQPGITAHQAVAAAVLLRIVWFAAEIVSAGALYYFVRPQKVTPPGTP